MYQSAWYYKDVFRLPLTEGKFEHPVSEAMKDLKPQRAG
jgi:hypothetical protein